MNRILIAEDSTRLAAFLEKGLRANGFTPTVVGDGAAAALMANDDDFELLILDLGLPGKDGFAVLRDLRSRGQRLPTIVLTARDDVSDKVAGLEGGADDYVTKSFSYAVAQLSRNSGHVATGRLRRPLRARRLRGGEFLRRRAARCRWLDRTGCDSERVRHRPFWSSRIAAAASAPGHSSREGVSSLHRSNGDEMATLHIEHPITDLQTWLGAFTRFEEARRKAGVRAQRVRQPVDDDKYIYVTLDFDSVEEAAAFKGFLETSVWASAEASPALDGTPTARVLTDVSTVP